MARRPRVEKEGFHHIVNRGVARGDIFIEDEDYEKFLELISISKERYDFTLHAVCLMNNHYHLLIETKHRNLSLLVRQINAPYAQYFNKKYNRVGPLWQGRFKNWFVYDDKYLSVLFRYIEQNPTKAKISKVIGEYGWASSSLILKDRYRELFKESLLLKEGVYSMLNKSVSESEYRLVDEFQKIVYQQQEQDIVRLKQKSLDEHFGNYQTLKERNSKILEALADGYKQSEIARYLGLSSAGVSYIVRRLEGIGIGNKPKT